MKIIGDPKCMGEFGDKPFGFCIGCRNLELCSEASKHNVKNVVVILEEQFTMEVAKALTVEKERQQGAVVIRKEQ